MERVIQLMNVLELKVILFIGFLAGYVPALTFDYMRILTSILGTSAAGIIWIFLKPWILKLRKKILTKRISKK